MLWMLRVWRLARVSNRSVMQDCVTCFWRVSQVDPSYRTVSRAPGHRRPQVRQLEREKELMIQAYDQKVSELQSSVLVTRQDYSALRQEAEEYKRVRMACGGQGW